jgi:hypothetical protein|eukprot:COSAG01_NODE_7225_length_3297_cov_4.925578_4_plen_39_part_00
MSTFPSSGDVMLKRDGSSVASSSDWVLSAPSIGRKADD